MSYFNKFPKTKQNGVPVPDITRRVTINSEVDGLLYNYVPYEVKDGERPEEVAYYYYGDSSYAWLVLQANNIVDPYTQWPKTDRDLNEYIKIQYASQSQTTGNAVIEWAQNTTIDDNILYYTHRLNNQVRISVQTYNNFPTPVVSPTPSDVEITFDQFLVAGDYVPVRIYDYELELNELKKKIILIDRQFIVTVDKQVNEVLNG